VKYDPLYCERFIFHVLPLSHFDRDSERSSTAMMAGEQEENLLSIRIEHSGAPFLWSFIALPRDTSI
jgi:hypothetical protein